MRIYFASQSFYPHIGGVSTYLMNLSVEMVKRGHEVTEVHLRPRDQSVIDEIEGIEIHRVPKIEIDPQTMEGYAKFKEAVYTECHFPKTRFDKPINQTPGYEEFFRINQFFGEELRQLLEQKPAQVIHIHDFQLLFTYKYVPRGTPLILTWHIPFPKKMSPHLSEFLIEQLNQYDKVVFSSPEYNEAAIQAGLPKEKTVLIYPLCNTRLFKPIELDVDKTRKKFKLPTSAKIILCVQRIDPKSGHLQLVNAMPKILKKEPTAKLVFVGESSLSTKISTDRQQLVENVKKRVAELKIENQVLFLGNIDYYALPEVYNAVDVAVLVSQNEGFGLSITEAMACAKPVVATRVGGLPLQIQDGKNGFLVKTGDENQTAKAILKILKDPELARKFGKKSLEIVEEKFLFEYGIEKHLGLYTSLQRQKDELTQIAHLDPTFFRAIIADFDRTLIEKPAKAVFDKNDIDIELFQQLKKTGLKLLLATGRPLEYVIEMDRQIPGIWNCIIAENGAILYFPLSKRTFTITTETMQECRKRMAELDLPETTYGRVMIGAPIRFEKIIQNHLADIWDKLEITQNVDNLIICPLLVGKGYGVRIGLQYLGIDPERTIIFGDAQNDLDMFLNPGYKIAVQNADEKLKRLANHVTKEPANRGIREVLHQIWKT